MTDDITILGYTGWLLDVTERDCWLRLFAPEFNTVIAHHITLDYGVSNHTTLPSADYGYIVGEIIDSGVQALVVEIGGTTTRPDGGTFHITVSLDDGRYPQNAKTLVSRGWWPLDQPIKISLTPTFIAANI